MGGVVYLTGVPATGKTTVSDAVAASDSRIRLFSYSEHLGRRLDASRDDLRSQSESIVIAEVVHAVDEELVGFVAKHRPTASVLIDSHAVTYERYCYRAIPFKRKVLAGLHLDAVICLAAAADVIAARIAENPASRQVVSVEFIEHAQRLQEGVAMSYSVVLGIPLYVLDAAAPVANVAARVKTIVERAGKTSRSPE
jgi:adenylate kinase